MANYVTNSSTTTTTKRNSKFEIEFRKKINKTDLFESFKLS
jgi:hypothetical protein